MGANRDNPLVNFTGRLTVIKERSVVLLNETGGALWSSSPSDIVKESVAQLLDTGNLVLIDSGSGNYVWLSFDYPSNTLLPGIKLGWDSKTGLNRTLKSWRNQNYPSSGYFTLCIQLDGLP